MEIPAPRATVKVNFTEQKAESLPAAPLPHPSTTHVEGKPPNPPAKEFRTNTTIDSTLFRKPAAVSSPVVNQTICIVCRDTDKKTFHCVRCKSVLYCGFVCQKIHWPYHRKICGRLTELREKQVRAEAEASGGEPSANKHHSAVIPWLNLSGKVGLNNMGNSCYLNSALQCLSHVIPLTTHFLSDRYAAEVNTANRDGTGGELARCYAALLRDLWFSSGSAHFHNSTSEAGNGSQGETAGANAGGGFGRGLAALTSLFGGVETGGGARSMRKPFTTSSVNAISPVLLKRVLGGINEDYRGFVQQDTHDVLETLLDRLHEDVNKVPIPKPYVANAEGDGTNDERTARESWQKHLLRNDSVVDRTLGGQLRSQLTCRVCGHVSVSFDFTRSLSLAIPRPTMRLIRVTYVHSAGELSVRDHGALVPRPRTFALRVKRAATALNVKQTMCRTANATTLIGRELVGTPATGTGTGALERAATLAALLRGLSNFDCAKAGTVEGDATGRRISPNDIVLMELHGNDDPGPHSKGPAAMSTVQQFALDPQTGTLREKDASSPAKTPANGGKLRAPTHTISRLLQDSVPLSALRSEDKEYIAFRQPPEESTAQDCVILLQRSVRTRLPADSSSAIAGAGEVGGTPGKHVHFQEGDKGDEGGDDKNYDDSSPSTSVRLVGLPFACFINMAWSCARVRYAIWLQIRRYFLHQLVQASDLTSSGACAAKMARVRQVLKNIKAQAAIANCMNVRVVNQFGHGVRSEYTGVVAPTYPDWSVDPFSSTPAPAAVKPNYSQATRQRVNDAALGAQVPTNSNITIGEFLCADTAYSKTIPFLAVDYLDQSSTSALFGPDSGCKFSWLAALNQKEMDAVDVVISSDEVACNPGASLTGGLEGSDGDGGAGSCAALSNARVLDPIEKVLQQQQNPPPPPGNTGSGHDAKRPRIATYSVMMESDDDPSRDQPQPSKVIFAQDLSLASLPALPSSSVVTLDACLKYYTHREELYGDNAWYCSKCKKHQPAEKSVSLWRLPPVLLLTLKRFDFHNLSSSQLGGMAGVGSRGGMSYNEKIDTFVDFPVNGFDAYPYMSRVRRSRSRTFSNLGVADIIGQGQGQEERAEPEATGGPMDCCGADDSHTNLASAADDCEGGVGDDGLQEETAYDLFAVCNHIGRTGYGHYTAMARDWRTLKGDAAAAGSLEPDAAFGPWYYYDDDLVEIIKAPRGRNGDRGVGDDGENPLNNVDDSIKSSQAYILFYRRRGTS